MGLSGPVRIGTDDATYYYQITSSLVSYKPNHTATGQILPFSKFLTFIYPFKIYSPLDILFTNLLGISFLPYFTFKLADYLLKEKKTASFAKKLILFCPFTMANGLILMRDIWIVTFVVAGSYFFLKRNYFAVAVSVGYIAFIRFGSLIFFFITLLILCKYKLNHTLSSMVVSNLVFVLLIVLIIASFVFAFPLLITLSEGKLSASLFRGDIIRFFVRVDDDVFLLKLIKLPFLPRIILLGIFFFFAPFLKFQFYTLGVFNIRAIMTLLVTPLVLIFCWSNILKSSLFGISTPRNNIRYIFLISVFIAICLGIFSLQIRHKTVLMPFIYILMASGKYLPRGKYLLFITMCCFIIVTIQFVFL
jgi:hypothetical protein